MNKLQRKTLLFIFVLAVLAAGPSAWAENQEAPRDFFFSENEALPQGWKLSHGKSDLKEFTPNYLPFNGNTIQRIYLIPSDIVEKRYPSGDIGYVTQDGRYIEVRGTYINIVIHYRFSETAQKGYYYDFLTNIQETIKDPTKRLSNGEVLVGRFRDEGVKDGYISVNMGDPRRVGFQCGLVKGNWWVEVELHTPNPKELERAQAEQITRHAGMPGPPQPVSQAHGDEAMLRFFASRIASAIPPDEDIPKLIAGGAGRPGGAVGPTQEGPATESGPSAPLPAQTVALAVAGGSIVMSVGAFLQLMAMGGFQNIGDLKSVFGSLFNVSEEAADLDLADLGIDDTPPPDAVGQPPKPKVSRPAGPQAEPPKTPVEPPVSIPDPIPLGFEYQGKVWFQPPWDKGGPYWMSKADYSRMRSMMREGKVWSDAWGWIDPKEGAALDAQRAADWDRFKSTQDSGIKAIQQQIQDTQQKIAQLQAQRAQAQKQFEIDQLRDRLAQLEKDRQYANSLGGQLKAAAQHFASGVAKDAKALPGELLELAKEAAKKTKDALSAAGSALADPDNYKAAGQAAIDTAKQLIVNPMDSASKLGAAGKTAAGMAGNLAAGIAANPVGFAKGLIGIDNWEKALDPNVPVGERVARALYGAVDASFNLASGGTKAAVKGLEAGLDASKTAKLAAKLDDPARIKAWEAGRLAGQKKVDDLKNALKSGDADGIKKALVNCQQDKHATQTLNRGDDSLKSAFNEGIKKHVLDDVDHMTRQKIAQRYGVDPKDVEIVTPANPSTTPKVGSDRDFTIRVKAKVGEIVPDPDKPGNFIKVKPGDHLTKDVPIKDAQAIYNRELYSKVTGESIPNDPTKFNAYQAQADKLAHDMDHVPGHRMGPESYGRSQKDLDAIIDPAKRGGQFSDPQQVGMAASYKSTHLYQQAEGLAKIDPHKAEQLIADGMRQTTKQYNNLIEPRVGVLQGQGVPAAVDPKLTQAVGILKKVETQGLAPAMAEKMLKDQMGLSKDDVARMLGSQLTKFQMMKP